MKLKDLTLKQFLEMTAANEAVPGGGSSAALSAAIATALIEMMANLTIGKKKYADVEERMRMIAAEMSVRRSHFLEDIDRDAGAYLLVMDAYRLPKETEAEMITRNEKIEKATKIATLVPMEVAERAYSLLDTMMETLEKGNRNAVTDGLVGLMMCRTAIMGALLNVRTNLGGIRDIAFVAEMKATCDAMEKKTLDKEKQSIQWVKTVL
ncbi:cyclodeaminase/cyclohydrolase family protein [Proteiniphilum sp. UBA1028]|jgi:formiminotetrahydrofolate cyclodeaminase|uniref:cyclodeaminase/cyclohydrolase family protein n=1 Tax=Proteiniphilum sp. UBA1028 TaxID=1947251 RepID=UPI000E89DD0E|nr:cyclodeaminase/cyclohydrolase family protein [Proteiniphilum sp. UBA1028]HBG57266.1 methenyltetrahydrofolate cyclohydrolase [Porphyromonadaceae bacterium]